MVKRKPFEVVTYKENPDGEVTENLKTKTSPYRPKGQQRSHPETRSAQIRWGVQAHGWPEECELGDRNAKARSEAGLSGKAAGIRGRKKGVRAQARKERTEGNTMPFRGGGTGEKKSLSPKLVFVKRAI